MVEQEFRGYLALLRSLLRLNGEQRDQIGHELRDHLESRLEALVEAGKSRDEAIAIALEEFGDAAAMASNLAFAARHQRRRNFMRFTTLSIIGLFAAALFTMSIWPANGTVGPNPITASQDQEADDSSANSDADTAVAPRPVSPTIQRNRAINEALNQMVRVDYDETPFSEVIEEWQNRLQANMLIDESSGLADEDQITIRFPFEIRFKTALDFLLEQYDSTYYVKDGVIVICSNDAEEDISQFAVFEYSDNGIDEDVVVEMFPDDWPSEGEGESEGAGFNANQVDVVHDKSIMSLDDRLLVRNRPRVLRKLNTLLSKRCESHPDVCEERTNNKLDELISMDYDETPFSEVIEAWQEKFAINFYLHPESGLDAEEPVNISLQKVRMHTALELFLNRFDSTYFVKDGVVVICSKDFEYDVRVTKTYFLENMSELIDQDVITQALPNDWQDVENVSMYTADDRLIVRHRPSTIRKIDALIATFPKETSQ